MFSLTLWLTYIIYLVALITVGLSGWQIPSPEHAYVVLTAFALLTWLTMTTPINKTELALGEFVYQGYWHKNLTLCSASGAAVIFSGIMMLN